MKKTCYDLKIYDNGMMLGVLQEDIEALSFFDYRQKMSLGSTQGIYIDESGKEHRLVICTTGRNFADYSLANRSYLSAPRSVAKMSDPSRSVSRSVAENSGDPGAAQVNFSR